MCGIAGFLYASNKTAPSWANEKTMSAMLDSIAHRGPDDRGVEVGNGYMLGHVRLSIIDTSDAGHQPMWSADGRYCLIYNGEIYNYKALREALAAQGYSFKTQSDTEVLLYALVAWGASCFDKLEGMFAGVFYDTETKESLVFRDQLGIKPLYYSYHDGALLFASEVKALRPILSHFSVDHGAVYEHIHFRYAGGARTLYQNIFRLLPGHYIKVSAQGDSRVHNYYTVTKSLKSAATHDVDLPAIEEALLKSIHAHTVSDVGYAVQLSGGIDSTYVTSVLSQSKKDLDTYAVTLPGQENDEEFFQRQVVEKCGTRHHSVSCDGVMFADLFPEVVDHLDFPVVHAGSVFLYLLCRHISQDHKVVLTGEGADELFLGYSRYNLPLAARIAFTLQKLGISPALIPDVPKLRAVKRFMQRDLGMDSGVFHSDVVPHFLQVSDDLEYRRDVVSEFDTLLDQMIATDQRLYLGSLLERQDKISMAHGLEVRVPFCNHQLYDLINPLSHKDKINPVPKSFLKSILAKQYPQEFVYRRKNGFKLPLGEWVSDKKAMGRYLDFLTDDTFRQRGLYKADYISGIVDSHLKGEHDYGNEIFNLLSLELWMRQVKV